jgi:DNA-binding response OmpR family regulator
VTTVLLVDDEPAMAGLVNVWLSDLGIRVVQASGLSEALKAIDREQPRAVLLDLSLGEEDGLEIMPRLQEALEGVPIIAFTVHDSREEEARRHGVSGFISKPFRGKELREVVEGTLR